MVLRLVSGPMLKKSNKFGSLADRQKVLLMARLRVSFFLGFSTTRETGNFQKFSRELLTPGNSQVFGRKCNFGNAKTQSKKKMFF